MNATDKKLLTEYNDLLMKLKSCQEISRARLATIHGQEKKIALLQAELDRRNG